MRTARRALATLAFLAWAPVAAAHAFLEYAEPRVGSTVDRSPPQVTLHFTEVLEPAFSSVKVFDAAGREIDRKDGKPDAGDRSVMKVSIPPLAPGKYRVEWRALSADTHVTKGDFTFEVRP